jgi:hypothetical protein
VATKAGRRRLYMPWRLPSAERLSMAARRAPHQSRKSNASRCFDPQDRDRDSDGHGLRGSRAEPARDRLAVKLPREEPEEPNPPSAADIAGVYRLLPSRLVRDAILARKRRELVRRRDAAVRYVESHRRVALPVSGAAHAVTMFAMRPISSVTRTRASRSGCTPRPRNGATAWPSHSAKPSIGHSNGHKWAQMTT